MNTYLSIDIGGTYIKYGEVTTKGEIINHKKVLTPNQKLSEFLKAMNLIIDEYKNDISGIAVSVPGRVNKDGSISFGGALNFLDGVNLKSIIQDYSMQSNVHVENDGKANLLAEMWHGAFVNTLNCATIALGTGIGGGIAINGKLIYGAHQQAGEISFMVNRYDPIGNSQIASNNSSAVVLVQTIAKELGLDDINDGRGVFKAIEGGDKTAVEMFQAYCKRIAYLIVNIQVALDLSSYVISGGISEQEVVTKTINEQYDEILREIPILSQTIERPQIIQSTYGNQANMIGAVYGLLGDTGN